MSVLLDSCTAFCAAMNDARGAVLLVLGAVVLVVAWLRNCKHLIAVSLAAAAADKKAEDALAQIDAIHRALRAHSIGEPEPKQGASFVTWIEDGPKSDSPPERPRKP